MLKSGDATEGYIIQQFSSSKMTIECTRNLTLAEALTKNKNIYIFFIII